MITREHVSRLLAESNKETMKAMSIEEIVAKELVVIDAIGEVLLYIREVLSRMLLKIERVRIGDGAPRHEV